MNDPYTVQNENERAVTELLRKAGASTDSACAMRLAQAALNAANAICVLKSAALMK